MEKIAQWIEDNPESPLAKIIALASWIPDCEQILTESTTSDDPDFYMLQESLVLAWRGIAEIATEQARAAMPVKGSTLRVVK